jgi:5'-deoxynucleotidase YfbR-like HD superfamily hydrolase
VLLNTLASAVTKNTRSRYPLDGVRKRRHSLAFLLQKKPIDRREQARLDFVTQAEVAKDIEALFFSAQAASLRRFYNQPYWGSEGQASDKADRIENGMRLESVADHSWKVADAVMLLSGHFLGIDRGRCIELALVHDKLELIMGDWSPIDTAANGQTTHAFNPIREQEKKRVEEAALDQYLSTLRPELRAHQRALFLEVINESSLESRLVMAIDKLDSLMFVLQKKKELEPQHLEFTIRYAHKSVDKFPAIEPYYTALVSLLRTRFQNA